MDGASRISQERQRQVAAEKFSAEHDAAHPAGALALAAAAYLIKYAVLNAPMPRWLITRLEDTVTTIWPWRRDGFKCDGSFRDLEKAGALAAAEWDRRKKAEQELAACLRDESPAGQAKRHEGGAARMDLPEETAS